MSYFVTWGRGVGGEQEMASCLVQKEIRKWQWEWSGHSEKEQWEGVLGSVFCFLLFIFMPSAFQNDVLSFLFSFKGMMDPCRIILNASLISFFSSLQHCYGNKRKYDFTERNVEINSEQNEHFGQYPFWKFEICMFFVGGNIFVHAFLSLIHTYSSKLPSSVAVKAIVNYISWICPALLRCESSYCLLPEVY